MSQAQYFIQSPGKSIEKYFFKGLVYNSVGSNLVRFGGSFGFLRFGRFEVRFRGSANLSEPF